MSNQDRGLPSLKELLVSSPRVESVIRSALERETILVLGIADPTEEISYDNRLLQFTYANDDRTFVPVFTSSGELGTAISHSPEWGALAILETIGTSILKSLQSTGVIVVINPWTPAEFFIAA